MFVVVWIGLWALSGISTHRVERFGVELLDSLLRGDGFGLDLEKSDFLAKTFLLELLSGGAELQIVGNDLS